MDYLKRLIAMKLQMLPSAREARLWSRVRMSGGPMTIAEYERYATHIDVESAERMLTLRARTAIGWFAASCLRWLMFWDVDTYEANRAAS